MATSIDVIVIEPTPAAGVTCARGAYDQPAVGEYWTSKTWNASIVNSPFPPGAGDAGLARPDGGGVTGTVDGRSGAEGADGEESAGEQANTKTDRIRHASRRVMVSPLISIAGIDGKTRQVRSTARLR